MSGKYINITHFIIFTYSHKPISSLIFFFKKKFLLITVYKSKSYPTKSKTSCIKRLINSMKIMIIRNVCNIIYFLNRILYEYNGFCNLELSLFRSISSAVNRFSILCCYHYMGVAHHCSCCVYRCHHLYMVSSCHYKVMTWLNLDW